MEDYNPCDPRIHYVSPIKVFPYLGYAWPKKGVVWIDNSLRKSLQAFIISHEMHHLNNKNFFVQSVFKRELLAYGYAIIRHPIGALKAIRKVMFSWERLIAVFTEKELKEGQ